MSDLSNRPTSYKSLKELRKGAKKSGPSVPPPPPSGGSYSSAGGYGNYGTADGSFGTTHPPAHVAGTGSNGAVRKGWSGSVENKMRQPLDSGNDYSYSADTSLNSSANSGTGSRWGMDAQSPTAVPESYADPHSREPSAAHMQDTTSSRSGSKWGWGGKKNAPTSKNASASTSRSSSYDIAPSQGGTRSASTTSTPAEHKRSWLGRSSHHEPEVPASYPTFDPATGRYIPPSERTPAQATHHEQSWGEWASSGVNSAWTSTSTGASTAWSSTTKAAQDSWDSVNDANKRDQALGAVGTGAAKVVGGAIKYTGKGIWAVGKAAMK